MANTPLRGNLHTDALLSDLAVKYSNNRVIHDKIAPVIPVRKQSDLYRTYNRNFIIPETNRAIGGLAREHVFDVGTSSYSLEKHALVSYLPDASKENFDGGDLRADLVVDMLEKLGMRMESQCAALFTTTSWSLGGSLAAADLWLTTTATPINHFDTAMATVVSNSGFRPNYAVIPQDSYNVLKNHPSIVDRVKYTSRELNSNVVAALIGVGEIHVPDMYVDSGLYGASAATGAVGAVWKQDFAFIGYKSPSPSMFQASSLYRFMRNKPAVRAWREEEREAEAIEVDYEYSFKVVASLTGYYLNNTI